MKYIAIAFPIALTATFLWNGACADHTPPFFIGNTGEGNGAVQQAPSGQPDDNANIIGKVISSDGSPLEGVAVSDGIEVVTTDKNGQYRISSDKSKGYVFISVPGNYTVAASEGIPAISCPLTLSANQIESHDFTLYPARNDSYSLIIHADQHLANRTNDIQQFYETVVPDINATIKKRRAERRQVYSLSLGDISWEQFWTANRFGLKDAAKCFVALDCQTFHSIGNHDNNPYISDDWLSSSIFRQNIAPTYYSFNIGKVHYIVLDNVIYNNPGASPSEMGERTYDRAISSEQLKWLKADLATISDKTTPLVVCGHVPFLSAPRLSGQTAVTGRNLLNMAEFEQIVADFSNVTIFSGHYHRNSTVNSPYAAGMKEYNVASLSGTLWWTGNKGYAGNHICTDGSPGGYGILDVDGESMSYRYKSIGYEENYQFRVYDLNTVLIDKTTVSNIIYREKVKEYADVYFTPNNNNEILVNVFNWGPEWKIEITEEGKKLSVKRMTAKDPLHILSYECQRLSHGALPTATATLSTQNSIHFFKATASKVTSSVCVTVTDDTGQTYTQTIKRPKKFSTEMR